MAHDSSDAPEQRQMTTDRDQIREWAETRDAIPVTTSGSDEYTFLRREDLEDTHEERTWDEFFQALEDEDRVFVYHEEETTESDLGYFELVDRDRAFDRAALEREEFEDAIRRGETVTTEVVETQVVEREIVERDTIESEIVDSEVTGRDVVDSERLSREVVETDFVSEDVIEILVEERRLETIEEVEYLTVESRVVDVDVEQRDTVESDEIETQIELESVQRSILESDVVRSDVTPDEVLGDERIRSQRTEGDAVHTELVERRTIEEEVEERIRMRFTLEETELLESEVVERTVIEGELVDVDEHGQMAEAGDETLTGSETDDVEAADAGSPAPATGPGSEPGETGAGAATGIDLSSDDEGKTVVDERGEEIGIVAEVDDGGTMYVDPQPGLTDRLKARFGWGGHGDDDYPVEPAQIRDVTDDEVVLRGEE